MRRAKIELYRGIECKDSIPIQSSKKNVAQMESAVLLRTGENKKANCTSTDFEINDNTWND